MEVELIDKLLGGSAAIITALAALLAAFMQGRKARENANVKTSSLDAYLREQMEIKDKQIDECEQRCTQCEQDHEDTKQELTTAAQHRREQDAELKRLRNQVDVLMTWHNGPRANTDG